MQLKSYPTISLNVEKYTNTPILCILGVLANDRGIEIKHEMLRWITSKYDCISVHQDYPGKLFEYPALSFAQYASIRFNKPVLYVHTKGAFHATNVCKQHLVRKLWYREFILHYQWYLDIIKHNKKVVACPFIGDKAHTTWTNGFIATPDAWMSIPVVPKLKDRLPYEHLFRDANINAFGRILNNVNSYDSSTPGNPGVIMTRIINAL